MALGCVHKGASLRKAVTFWTMFSAVATLAVQTSVAGGATKACLILLEMKSE